MYQHILRQRRFHNWMVTTEFVNVPKSMDSHDTLKSTAKRKCAHQIYYWVGFHRNQNRSIECHIGQCHSQQPGGGSSPSIQQLVQKNGVRGACAHCVHSGGKRKEQLLRSAPRRASHLRLREERHHPVGSIRWRAVLWHTWTYRSLLTESRPWDCWNGHEVFN